MMVVMSRSLFALSLLAVAAAPAASLPLPEKVRYNEHIRPILSTNCFYCHGPDEKHREAKLRLDTREGATADLEGDFAIVPGKPDKSELLRLITSDDRDEMMPPPKSKKPKLSERDVALLRKWIEQGAEYEAHWAFLPLASAEPPAVKNAKWARNGVDRFILARLEKEGIEPSPEADRTTLCRRVSLDLTGLLPSPEEVDAFVKDPAPDAYEKLVDRLLASPHYGERWARHWLDQARYADSNGYSIDSERAMWPYRDWVIAALNADEPFDKFTVDQLAGDLLPSPTKAQLVATAFHRNTLINEEGGSNPEQFRVEACIDRVNTTGAVWLGLTVGCAQCHSHKFDPITQREFYEMFAFFNSGEDVNNKGATVPVARGEMFGAQKGGATLENDDRLRDDWEAQELAKLEALAATAGQPAKWVPARYKEFDSETNSGIRQLPDGSLLADGQGSANDTYRVSAEAGLPKVAAVRLRVLIDDSLPAKGPGWAGNGNFVLTQIDISVGDEPQRIAAAFADHEQANYPVSAAFDGNPRTGWAINTSKASAPGVKMNAPHEAVFILQQPIVTTADKPITVRLRHEMNERYLIGRFALDFSATAPAPPKAAFDAELLAALRVPRNGRFGPGQAERVNAAFDKAHPRQKDKATRQRADADSADVMVMSDLPKPRETYLFQRGDFLRPDKQLGVLQPGVLHAVSATFAKPPGAMKNRLDLARWLVSPENALTPRVAVNRVWAHYFGRGIVETDEDFGAQGSAPVHPELLDWLAWEFSKTDGWSYKKLHRLIVTSATYRQSSKARPDLAEKDARNLFLARQERLRVEAEIVRDSALCASGLLDRTIGGPGVRPPQPDGVYSFTQTAKSWKTSPAPARFRRGLYTVFYRSSAYPLLGTFDVPDMQTTCTRRARSNTPLQSLTLANDGAFLEIAEGLANRLAKSAPDLDARLKLGFRLTVCREPSAQELGVLRDYTKRQAEQFTEDTEAAKALAPRPIGTLPPGEAAALLCAARVLINTDNFITRE